MKATIEFFEPGSGITGTVKSLIIFAIFFIAYLIFGNRVSYLTNGNIGFSVVVWVIVASALGVMKVEQLSSTIVYYLLAGFSIFAVSYVSINANTHDISWLQFIKALLYELCVCIVAAVIIYYARVNMSSSNRRKMIE